MKSPLREPPKAALVRIPVNGIELEGALAVPAIALGIVIFAHGSGSSRHSPRNQFVARRLQEAGLATLLVDLLTLTEDTYYGNRFDISLLTERVIAITDWVGHTESIAHLGVGYFAASTGAAAALKAAVLAPDSVRAVVARGGRVDMAEDILAKVEAPTMLIVGQRDLGVRQVNEDAFLRLQCHKELAEVPNATHLFDEPGALERVAELAGQWFTQYLSPAGKAAQPAVGHSMSPS